MLCKKGIFSYWGFFIILCLLFMFAGCATKNAVREGRQIEKTAVPRPKSQDALPELNKNSTLDDYLKYAELNNAGLQAAYNDWKAELSKVPQAKSFDDPNFTFNYSIRAMSPVDDNSWNSIQLTQMIPFFGKLGLKKKVALQSAEVARQKYETEKRKLVQRVKNVYYDYYYQNRTVAVMQENLELMKTMEEIVRVRYKTDEAGYPDLLRVQVELRKMENELRTMTDMLQPKAAQLNAALNRSFGASVYSPKVLKEEKLALTAEEISSRLLSNNPEIAAMEHEVEMAGHSLRLARIETLPDFMLGVEYQAMTADVMNDDNPVMAMVGFNIPLWRGKYRGMIAESEAMLASVKGKLEEMKNSLSADLEMALYEYRDAERRISLYKDSLLPKAAQSLSSVQQAFAAGKMGFLDVIDAIRSLLEFKLSYEEALTDRAKSIAMIEMLTGKIFVRENNQ